MASIPPPFLPFYATGAITGCEKALQRNVVGLFVGGCGCGCTLRWNLTVGGFLSAPKIPISKKLRSDQLASASQNLSDLDHVRGEVMHIELSLGRILFWSCRLNVHLAHCYYDTIALSQENKSCLILDTR